MGSIRLWGQYSGLGLIVAFFALMADKLHKHWMIEIYGIAEKERVAVTSFLDLVMAWNPGVSYGLFAATSDMGRYILVGFAVIAILILFLWMNDAASRMVSISVGLIIGGAIGNVSDRLTYGAVADFFSFHYEDYYWYVFNVADVAIAVGVIGLVLDWIWPSHTKVPKDV